MDLLWSIASRNYENLPMPSEIYNRKSTKDKRSGQQIITDLVKKLGGE